MKQMKKIISVLLVLTFLTALVTGCQNTEQTGEGAAQEATTEGQTQEETTATDEAEQELEQVEITIASQFGGTNAAAPPYQAALEQFQLDNPHVKIMDSSQNPDEAWKQKIVLDFSVGNEPDVLLYFTGVDQKPIVESGKVVSIDTIRKDYPDYASNINKDPMEMVKAEDGVNYCVPVSGFYEGMFVNKDLFDEYGLELPTDWDKFMTAVETFADTDIVPISVALGNIPHYVIEHFILSAGGVEEHRVNPKTKEEIPQSWIEGLDNIKMLYDMGAFPQDTLVTEDEFTVQAFVDKKAAMVIDGSWLSGRMVDTENTVFLPFPSSTDKKDPSSVIAGFSSGFFISEKAYNDSAKQKAVVDLVSYLTSDEVIRNIVTANAGMPAASVVAEADNPLLTSMAEVTGAAKGADMPIDSRLQKPAWEIFTKGIPLVVEGKITSEELLLQVVEENNY